MRLLRSLEFPDMVNLICFHTLNHISGMQILGGEAPVVWGGS